MNMLMNQEQILVDGKLREQLISRVEVLDKVGKLLTLPKIGYATTQQVAEFYNVPIKTISSVVSHNKEEIEQDGYIIKTGNEIKDLFRLKINPNKINNKRGYFLVDTGDQIIKLANTSTGLFTKRAVLRVGMLLRDSEVAREVRTQLLNIEENTSNEVKTADLEKEQRLMFEVGKAIAEGNTALLAQKMAELNDFKNRHIKQLENALEYQKNVTKGLVKEISVPEKRQILNQVVRKGVSTGESIQERWNTLYHYFNLKYHCNVHQRYRNYQLSFDKPYGKVTGILDYIDKVMDMLPELYEIAVKLYESDVNDLISEMYRLNA